MKFKFNYPYYDPELDGGFELGEIAELSRLMPEGAEFKNGFRMPLNLFFKITEPVKEKATTKKADCISSMRVVELYNESFAGTMARQKRAPTDALKASIKSRSSDLKTERDWIDLFEAIKLSPFLMGKVQSGDRKPFQLTIEWLVKPGNLSKVLDGYFHGE